MSDPIPGWYPDPEEPSRQRFWDGTRWTEARAYPVAMGLDGAPVPDAAAAESRGTNWALIVGLVVLLLVVLAAVWFFLLRGGSSEPVPAPVPTTAPTAPTAVPTAPTKAPTAPPVSPTAPPTAPTAPPTAPTGVPTP